MKSKKYLNECIDIRSSNLNLIRFVAAILVILCHSYPLSNGGVDPLSKISGGTLGFGNLAVAVFFISSGLLVAKSIERKKATSSYFKSRCIKIFPPLILTVLVSIILLGLLFSTLDNVNYFTSTNTYKYLLNAILIPVHQLPGVFNSNIYGSVVNGSLWTLPVEFICYIILFIVYRLYILDKKIFNYTIIPVTFVFVFVNISNVDIITVLSNYFEPLFMFYMGVILYVYKDIIYFGNKIFAISVIGFLLTVFFKMAWVGLFIFFPYILIYLSFGIKQISNSVDILGAISYGIYLCGFPIQQSIVYLNGGCMNSYMNFIIAAPLSILCGAIIYYISEKKLNEFVIKYK